MDVFSDTTGEKYLYRYRSANHFTIDEVLNHYIYMTARADLNDLNEFKWRLESGSVNMFDADTEEKASWIIEGIKSHAPNPTEALELFTEQCVYQISKGGNYYIEFVDNEFRSLFYDIYKNIKEHYGSDDIFRIACFSKKSLNATMMGHYGSNEGVVIAYDVQEIRKQLGPNSLVSVNYTDKPFAYPITKLSNLNTPELFKDIHTGMCATKLEDWSYEKEVRMVLRGGNVINNIDHQLVLFPSVIAGVCLAPKASKQFSSVLISTCLQRKIPVFEALNVEGAYNFEAQGIDLKKYKYF